VAEQPYVRTLGTVDDIDEAAMIIGVDYDSVTINSYRFSTEQCEVLGALFIAACWQAGRNAERMEEDERHGV
jgi:hypothetical protein